MKQARRGKKGGKRSVVQVITSEKVIQSVMTSSLVGIFTSFFEGASVVFVAAARSVFPVFLPVKWVLAVFLAGLFALAYWADNNTEEFREIVEDATGEEASDGSAE